MEAIFERLTQLLSAQMLQGELTVHLGYPPGETLVCRDARGWTRPKAVPADEGPLDLTIPQQRACTLSLRLVPWGVRWRSCFDQKVLQLTARGMTVR